MATGLQIKVGADTTEFRQEIRELPREFEKAEQEISASADRVNTSLTKAIGKGLLQGIAAGGIVYKVREIIAQFDQVADSARRFGTTAEDIQRVDVAARQTGSSLESVASAMEAAGVRAAKAAREGGESLEKFDRANIDATAFAAADLATKVEMVAAAQRAAAGDFTALSAITEALGEAVGGVDFDGMAKGMKNVSVLSNDTVRSLSEANTEIEKFQRGITLLIGGGLGMLGRGVQRMTTAIMASAEEPFKFGPQDEDSIFGKTRDELEELTKKRRALFELGQKGITNPTDEQVAKHIADALEEQKNAQSKVALAAEATRAELEKNEANAENQKNIKQRLLEIQLSLKEAEAAQNNEMAEHLRYQEDLYKGILKYKDAEDAYGMAVREANAELAKRKKMLDGGNKSEFEQVRAKYIEGLSKFTHSLTPEEQQARAENSRRYHELTRMNPELLNTEGAFATQKQEIFSDKFDQINQIYQNEVNKIYDFYEKVHEKAKRQNDQWVLENISAMRQQKIDILKKQYLDKSAEIIKTYGDLSEMHAPQRTPRAFETNAPNQDATSANNKSGASEDTLQKAVALLEELNTKLPLPVLV